MERKKLMIVDDNVQVLEILDDILGDKFEVSALHSGKECIEKIKDFNPSLLVLDIGLPDMSGYDVCEKIKQNGDFETLPILMLSGSTGAQARKKGYSSGAINYIEKPFDVGEFLQIIDSTLRNQPEHSSSELVVGNIKADLASQVITIENKPIKLTRNEFKILQTFLSAPGTEFKRDELTLLLHSDEADYEEENLSKKRSIDTHISTIRKKIAHSDIQIKSIYGKGYQMIPK